MTCRTPGQRGFRYFKPEFGCLRCSGCNSRRCLMFWSASWLARRVPLRASRARCSAPADAWSCRAGDGSALEPGERGVPGDSWPPIPRDPRWVGALRLAGRRRGAGCHARRTAMTPIMPPPHSCGGDMSRRRSTHLPGTIRQPLLNGRAPGKLLSLSLFLKYWLPPRNYRGLPGTDDSALQGLCFFC